jgi:hypothetical protein
MSDPEAQERAIRKASKAAGRGAAYLRDWLEAGGWSIAAGEMVSYYARVAREIIREAKL